MKKIRTFAVLFLMLCSMLNSYAAKEPEYQEIKIGMNKNQVEQNLRRFGDLIRIKDIPEYYRNFVSENHATDLCQALYNDRLWRNRSVNWLHVTLASGASWLDLGFYNGKLNEMILYPASLGIDEDFDNQSFVEYLSKQWKTRFQHRRAKITHSTGRVNKNTVFRNGIICYSGIKLPGRSLCVILNDRKMVCITEVHHVTRINSRKVYSCERCRVIGFSPVKRKPIRPLGGLNPDGDCKMCNGTGRDRWYKIYPPSFGLPSGKPIMPVFCLTCGWLMRPHSHPRPCSYCK